MSILAGKKVVIIGAGISGLTAGIYALDNGFDVGHEDLKKSVSHP